MSFKNTFEIIRVNIAVRLFLKQVFYFKTHINNYSKTEAIRGKM